MAFDTYLFFFVSHKIIFEFFRFSNGGVRRWGYGRRNVEATGVVERLPQQQLHATRLFQFVTRQLRERAAHLRHALLVESFDLVKFKWQTN